MNEPLKQFHRSRAPARGCPYYTRSSFPRPCIVGAGLAPALEHRPYLLKSAPMGDALLSSEGVYTVSSRGSPSNYRGPCGCLPLFSSSGMTRFIRHRCKIRDESCFFVIRNCFLL